MNSPPTNPCGRPDEAGWLARVRAAHFHDYTPAAFRLWLALVLAGIAALAGALGALSKATSAELLQTATGLFLVGTAAWFPVEIPRSKYSISAADAFIFTILAVLGTPAAILAAGCDGLIGAWRSSKRLTSRISTPATAMAAMAVCGTLFGTLSGQLLAFGASEATARLAALVMVGLVPFVLTTLPLMATVTLKGGAWPDLRQWFSSVSWVGAMYVAAALVAGIVQLGAIQQGPVALGIIAVATLGALILLRVSIARNEAAHRAQEAQVQAAQREAELNLQRFAAAFADAAIGMAIVERGGIVLRANRALCALLRRSEADLTGHPFCAVLHPTDVELFERQAREVTTRGETAALSIELRCRASDGIDLWVALHCGRFNEPGSGVEGLIYQLHDITPRQVAEARLQHIAYHDDLTDLANRSSFHQKLSAAVETSSVDPRVHFAVLFLDVDRFKVVNDSLGHIAGNELLREVGKRLQQCVRPDDVVARLGGDEFAVLLQDLGGTHEGLRVAERMLAGLAVPLSMRGNEIMPSVSIGITFSDLGYRTVDELVRDADLAMYEAKAAGRGRMAVFDRTMHDRIADKLALEADLRRAIGDGELSLVFQPLFNLDPHQVVSFEALARWTHPARGPVSPSVFVGLAEEAGQIEALTAWAIENAVANLAAWHRLPGMANLSVNVNISGRDLSHPDFADNVLDALRRHDVAPNLLTLEITESVLMHQLDLARATLGRLRTRGVGLAIDDFGTGYSSLAYLGKLPIDCLKIDRSFVMGMGKGSENVEIVRAVLMLGRALSKRVVAEGVETPQQLEALRRLGVHIGQGNLLGRPVHAEQVPALLQEAAAQPT